MLTVGPRNAQVWKISKFAGEAEHTLRAEVILVATTREKKAWGRPPISLNFQVRGVGQADYPSTPPPGPPFTPALMHAACI